PLILYEFEGCPFCRIAREAVSETGVTVIVRPCPKGGARFRPEVKTKGGKAQFPYLIDPNTGVSMYESADIASYLRKTYGGGRARPLVHWLGPFNQILSQFGVLARFFAGTVTLKSTQNAKPLEFQGAERDPGARLVKERLCSLELDYVWRPGAGPARLSDPNAGVTIQGGAAVRGHLRKSYAH
ncbi:MAG: glutathione S-transferase N-terminal domain-containing protein, partial [Pseudomonadota bacterium]